MIKKQPKVKNVIFKDKPSPSSMSLLADFVPYNPNRDLKKWCVEQALRVTELDSDGNMVQPDLIPTAQKIYDWVTK